MTAGRLAILGAGGHARVVADTAMEAGWAEVILFDDRFPDILSSGAWSVAGSSEDLVNRYRDFDAVIVGIGSNRVRLDACYTFAKLGAPLATIVHSRAWVSPRAEVAAGGMVAAGAMINVGAELGTAVIVNTGATVDHDCRIGDGVHIAPGANLSGDVRVGSLSWIGVGATVRQGITIGSGVVIGAGAVVVSDMPDGVTAVGCPARPRR